MQSRGKSHTNSPALFTRLQYQFLLLLIFIAGSSARLYRIADQVVLDDEWHALNAVQHHDFKWIFTHFGGSDHSIPLALLYELQYYLVGLNEILLRWPMLLAGCAALLILPYMMRHWLSRPERLLLAALLAISPVLIYYSRFARPYSILLVLESGALLMAWHWWKSREIKYGVAWILLAGVSAWLNTPALIIVTAPFVCLGVLATRNAMQLRDWSGLVSLSLIGIAILIVLAVLLGPPLTTQSEAILTKAGQHYIDWQTLPWALSLASGNGHTGVFAALGLLSVMGLIVLFRRDKDFAWFLLVTALSAMCVLIITGAAFAMHGNIFLRYLIGLLPFYLGLTAVGLVYVSASIVDYFRLPLKTNAGLLAIVCIALVASGPIPDWPSHNNQFVTHQNYHFHYNQKHNLYTQALVDWYQAEAFYAEIGALHDEGETLIVEAPWYMESYANPLDLQQEIHRQRVQIGFINGLCAGPLYGELTADQPNMKFRNFVYLQELLDGTKTADYLVLRRQGMAGLRDIDMDFDKCEHAVRTKFGQPWRESASALVFRITPKDG